MTAGGELCWAQKLFNQEIVKFRNIFVWFKVQNNRDVYCLPTFIERLEQRFINLPELKENRICNKPSESDRPRCLLRDCKYWREEGREGKGDRIFKSPTFKQDLVLVTALFEWKRIFGKLLAFAFNSTFL